jgi:transposase
MDGATSLFGSSGTDRRGGCGRAGAAARFRVSESCAIKLLQRWTRTGSVAPGRMGGTKRFALEPHEARVRALVAAQPDITLDELGARLAAEAIEVGARRSTVF